MVEGGSDQLFQRQPASSMVDGASRSVYRLVLAIAAAAAAVAVFPLPAQAAPACANTVLREWANGTLDVSRHSLECYEAAIGGLPEDLRAYTTAADDISRAAIVAARSDPAARELTAAPLADESDSLRAFPREVVLIGLLVTAVVAVGAAASLLGRRRPR